MAASRRFWTTALVCVAAATATVGATGCTKGADSVRRPEAGTSGRRASLDPDSLAAEAVRITKEAASLHVAGGPDGPDGGLRIDVAADERGVCAGTMDRQGTTADLLGVDGELYVRAAEPFWRAAVAAGKRGSDRAETDAMIGLLGDPHNWLRVSGPDRVRDLDLRVVCDLDTLREHVDQDGAARTGLSRAADTEVDGRKAVVLRNERLTLYVAEEGEPYVLRSVGTGPRHPSGGRPGATVTTTYTFSEHDETIPVTRPPERDIVDLEKLDAGF